MRFGLPGSMALAFVLSVVLSVALSGGCQSMRGGERDSEQRIATDKAPRAVQAAVRQVAGSNRVDQLTRETEDGKTIYEAQFLVNGMEQCATIAENGDIIGQEKQVDPNSLSAAVRDAVMKRYAAAKIDKAEMIQKDGKSYYELQVMTGGKKQEVKVRGDGQFLENARQDKDNDND